MNGHVTGLEALYEVVDVDGARSFSALIRGGQNAAGAALFEGVVLAGWRTGARVQVELPLAGDVPHSLTAGLQAATRPSRW